MWRGPFAISPVDGEAGRISRRAHAVGGRAEREAALEQALAGEHEMHRRAVAYQDLAVAVAQQRERLAIGKIPARRRIDHRIEARRLGDGSEQIPAQRDRYDRVVCLKKPFTDDELINVVKRVVG
jgi:hypothetical protein